MTVQYENPGSLAAPFGHYSHIAIDDRTGLTALAGQVGIDAKGHVVGPDVADQIRTCFENVATALEAAGSSPDNVLQFTTYLTDSGHVPAFYAVREEVFAAWYPGGGWPPNTLLFINRLLHDDMIIEIQTLAIHKDPARSR